MSCTPTKTAVGGKFQSTDGSDLMQWLNTAGKVVAWIDCNGVFWQSTTANGSSVSQQGLPGSTPPTSD
jgi:hypothetical protein